MLGNTIKRYLAELRTRVVWMYHQTRPDYAGDWPAMVKVAELVGVSSAETLRRWVCQDEVDQGQRLGLTGGRPRSNA